MSKATKKKYVKREIVESDYIPQNGQFIAKVIASRGNNLHEVEPQWSCEEESAVIVSMPVKFRKTIWIKRDNYVICDPIEEGTKVKGEIVACLLPEHIRHLRNNNMWPKKFDNSLASKGDSGEKQKGVDSYLNSDIPLPPSSDEDEQLSGNEDVCNLNRITSNDHDDEEEDNEDSDENS